MKMRYNRESNRRKRELQLRIRLTVLALSVFMLAGLAFGGIRSMASTDRTVREKLYTSVVVPYGESLEMVMRSSYSEMGEDVTGDYASYRKEVLSINRLQEIQGEIYPAVTPGTSVILPYYTVIQE